MANMFFSSCGFLILFADIVTGKGSLCYYFTEGAFHSVDGVKSCYHGCCNNNTMDPCCSKYDTRDPKLSYLTIDGILFGTAFVIGMLAVSLYFVCNNRLASRFQGRVIRLTTPSVNYTRTANGSYLHTSLHSADNHIFGGVCYNTGPYVRRHQLPEYSVHAHIPLPSYEEATFGYRDPHVRDDRRTRVQSFQEGQVNVLRQAPLENIESTGNQASQSSEEVTSTTTSRNACP